MKKLRPDRITDLSKKLQLFHRRAGIRMQIFGFQNNFLQTAKK